MNKKDSKIAFITGVLGQDGAYLSKFLLSKNYTVYGLIQNKNSDFGSTDYLGVTEKIKFIQGDMVNDENLNKIVKTIQPNEIYNLAAQSFVGSSWDQAKLTTEVNSLGTLYLLEATRKFSPNSKFFQAATSEMFGKNHDKGIQTEDTHFHPQSPYAISKLYAYWMTVNYRESYGLFACNGILFNHESPIRGLQFVTRKISDGVARIALGLEKEIRLGNITSRRDWGFAGDYVEAMWLMLQQQTPVDLILSTGRTHSIQDLLSIAFKNVGIDSWKEYVVIDTKFTRPKELLTLQGKSKKAKETLGWEPKTSFEELVAMMVNADKDRYARRDTIKEPTYQK